MNDHVPSLSTIVDQLTARIEHLEIEGPDDECRALHKAREVIVNHVLWEHRNQSIIATILSRLRLRPAA